MSQDLAAIFDADLGEEIAALRDSVRRFARDNIAPQAAAIDREDRFPRALWPAMGALGLPGMGRRQVERHITGIDLDDIVDQQHLHHAQHINRPGGMLGEHQRIEGEMP